MVFSSLTYLIFLPVVFCLYWLSSGRARKVVLLVASYVFYMSWLPSYGLLLFALTLANYLLGLALGAVKNKKWVLLLALAVNLGSLGYFKYANFFITSFVQALNGLGGVFGQAQLAGMHSPVLNIILPLGISFFVFEFIHYAVDVSKGAKPLRSFLDFSLFAAFFPSQISGPIKRYQDFNEKLNREKRLRAHDVVEGLSWITKGLFKKIALADNLAVVTAAGVNNIQSMGTLDAWALMFAFLLQVYFDFSGYTDMGIGSARLLGIKLPNNFDLPYIASKNLMEFWQRWHITLTEWLRDYVLVPMTGFRVSRLKFNAATITTMTLCGLWHGAAWHFVAWGFVHGVLLVLTREYQQIAKKRQFLRTLHNKAWMVPIACLSTFIMVHFTQSLFLAPSVGDALTIMHRMVFFSGDCADVATAFSRSPAVGALILYSLYGLVFVEIPWLPLRVLEPVKAFFIATRPRRLAFVSVAAVAALAFWQGTDNPFMYFQF